MSLLIDYHVCRNFYYFWWNFVRISCFLGSNVFIILFISSFPARGVSKVFFLSATYLLLKHLDSFNNAQWFFCYMVFWFTFWISHAFSGTAEVPSIIIIQWVLNKWASLKLSVTSLFSCLMTCLSLLVRSGFRKGMEKFGEHVGNCQ